MSDRSGLYRHYKNGQLYRFLLVTHMMAKHEDVDALYDDVPLKVFTQDDFVFIGQPGVNGSTLLFEARWSGDPLTIRKHLEADSNGGKMVPIAIYFAVYEDGRIAARPLEEFEAEVEHEGKKVPRFAKVG